MTMRPAGFAAPQHSDYIDRRRANTTCTRPGRLTAECCARPPSIRPGRLLEAVVERVARAAHGANRVALGIAIERAAQPADVDVHGALVDVDIAPPYAVEQLLAREYAAGPLHQIFEQAVFGRAQLDRPPGARYAAFLPVHLEVAEAKHVAHLLRSRAPQQGVDARNELGNRERLDDVIVGAGRQPAHPLALLAARRQYDDRDLPRLRPRAQPAADFDAGEPRQHPVQYHEIRRVFPQLDLGLVAARR